MQNMWRCLRKNFLNKNMIFYAIIAEFVFWSPVIVGLLITVLLSYDLWIIPASYIGFWIAPFTPAISAQLGLALLFKRFTDFIKHKNKRVNKKE